MVCTRNVKTCLIFWPLTQQARIDDEVHSIEDLTRLLKATNDKLKANTVQMTAMKAGTRSQDIHSYNDTQSNWPAGSKMVVDYSVTDFNGTCAVICRYHRATSVVQARNKWRPLYIVKRGSLSCAWHKSTYVLHLRVHAHVLIIRRYRDWRPESQWAAGCEPPPQHAVYT